MRQQEITVLGPEEEEIVRLMIDSGIRADRARVLCALAFLGRIAQNRIVIATGLRPSTVCLSLKWLDGHGVVERKRDDAGAGGVYEYVLRGTLADAAVEIVEHQTARQLRRAASTTKAAMAMAG